MASVLSRASCFIAIIILGYVLRKVGFFKEEDFHVLSRIVLKITLPAAVVSNFAGAELSPSMLILAVLGLLGGIYYIALLFFLNLHSSREQRAFEVLNSAGYNIGNFTMPFAQSFLGPTGVVVTSLFDVGNSVICLGGSYIVASMIKGGHRFSAGEIVKKLFSSVPFDAYILMTVLSLLHLQLPEPVVSFAGIIGNSNAFLAMLMIGVGFHLSGDRRQLGTIVRILSVRYAVALAFSLICYFVLPFPLEYRQALAILVFSPIASAVPAFTAELKGDIGLASAINSLSIIISIICIVSVLAIIL